MSETTNEYSPKVRERRWAWCWTITTSMCPVRPLPGRWRAQDLATDASRRLQNRPIYRGKVDEGVGIEGVVRGTRVRTMIPDKAAPCSLDLVNRQFRTPAPDMLWVSDFTYIATWHGSVYVALVIDAYARRIVGWRVSRTAHADFVLDAPEQAVHQRRRSPRQHAGGDCQRPLQG